MRHVAVRDIGVWAVVALSLSCSGDSPTEPPTLAEDLDVALASAFSAHDGTGVSAAVLVPGEAAWTGAAGVSHGSVAITPAMVFGVSSITKSYVAALLLDLAEDGLLSLDDSLQAWLPALTNVDSTITIRQLLNHTGGVFDFVEDPTFWPTILGDPTREWTPEEVIASFAGTPYFTPGQGFHYSNTGYLLLGMIVEAATGSSVSSALRSRLWDPLGLDSTVLDVEEPVVGVVAHAWNHLDNDGVLDDLSSIPRTASSSATWTAGAVFSTAAELAEWGRALFQGEVVTQASLDQMLAFGASGYGLGTDSFGPEWFGARAVGLIGSGLGYSGAMLYLEDYDTSIAVLMNDNNLDCLFAVVSALVTEVGGHLD